MHDKETKYCFYCGGSTITSAYHVNINTGELMWHVKNMPADYHCERCGVDGNTIAETAESLWFDLCDDRVKVDCNGILRERFVGFYAGDPIEEVLEWFRKRGIDTTVAHPRAEGRFIERFIDK